MDIVSRTKSKPVWKELNLRNWKARQSVWPLVWQLLVNLFSSSKSCRFFDVFCWVSSEISSFFTSRKLTAADEEQVSGCSNCLSYLQLGVWRFCFGRKSTTFWGLSPLLKTVWPRKSKWTELCLHINTLPLTSFNQVSGLRWWEQIFMFWLSLTPFLDGATFFEAHVLKWEFRFQCYLVKFRTQQFCGKQQLEPCSTIFTGPTSYVSKCIAPST